MGSDGGNSERLASLTLVARGVPGIALSGARVASQSVAAAPEGPAKLVDGRAGAEVVQIGECGAQADREAPARSEPAHAMARVDVQRGRPPHGQGEPPIDRRRVPNR